MKLHYYYEKFAITGVAGYIAPRHLQAIKETNNTLVAALDPRDLLGYLTDIFQIEVFLEKLKDSIGI